MEHKNRFLQHQETLQKTARAIEAIMKKQDVVSDFSKRQSGPKQEVLDSLLNRQQNIELIRHLTRLHPADIAFILESFSTDIRKKLWPLINESDRGAVMLELSDEVRMPLLGSLSEQDILDTAATMDTAQLAEFLQKNPHTMSVELLKKLNEQDRQKIQSTLSFPEDSVGSLMEIDLITVEENMTLKEIIKLLRSYEDSYEALDQIYVINKNGEYKGNLIVKKILFNPADKTATEIMEEENLTFFTDDPASDAVSAFERYDLISAPVLNIHNQVVGNIFVNKIIDYIDDLRETQQLKQAGFSEKEDIFTPIIQSARNRWLWLGLNLVSAFIASRIIGAFEDTINQLIALATLMPIVASVGGNTGNQTLALMVRSIALDQINRENLRIFFSKEIYISLINGFVWGLVVALFAYIFYGNMTLSFIMLAALMATLFVAAIAGIFIPFILNMMGRDPVLGSSVLLTAVTDSMGFFIFLGMASLLLI
ncbi:MAG: magnesium transporter [Proteobacteria bacterium]|nr:magnesium transporter [Pseudomonadota bacterium]